MVTLGRWLMTEWDNGVDGDNGMVVDNGTGVTGGGHGGDMAAMGTSPCPLCVPPPLQGQ